MGEMGGMKTKDGVLVIPPTGGAPMQGFEEILEQSWVTVLAKVPIKQQFQMYEDALATARGFNVTADQPQYIGYEVRTRRGDRRGTRRVQADQAGHPQDRHQDDVDVARFRRLTGQSEVHPSAAHASVAADGDARVG